MFSIVVVVNNLKRLRTLPDVFRRDLLQPVCQSSPFGRGTRGRRTIQIRLFLLFCFLQFSKLKLHKFCQRVPKQYSEPVARLPLDVCRSVLDSHSSARKINWRHISKNVQTSKMMNYRPGPWRATSEGYAIE